ncbi:glycosyltransferase family 4 protein [Mariluticola halotolerans]|uniref:glycosyltransferase family 4 protein n=1 Tax=Mariluticola halotolerans TaxID=2909283 RepID=UPI0026E3B60D|nr:glycosyltransferase family 4 protein [Mariluticola halotolerans]UJQ96063.1 glycosyltransferase family 4 protein [Mariluticola halotolerans]
MKILVITQFFPPELGGMQVSNGLVVEGLREAGVEVEVNVLGRPAGITGDRGAEQRDHPFSPTDLIGHFRTVRLMIARAKAYKPDYILLLDEGPVRAIGMYPFPVSRKIPIIGVNSGSILTRANTHLKGKLHAWLIARGYRSLSLLFVSNTTKRKLASKRPDIVDKIRALGRPIPASFFAAPADTSRTLPEVPVLFSAGRASPEKGVGLVLEALAMLAKKHRREVAEFWYAGEGAALVEWKALAAKLELTKVRFLGHVDFDELAALYRQSHCFILPSAGEMETFGRVWVEAMAASLPIITTDLDNLADLADDGGNGFVVRPTVASVAEGIERFLNVTPEDYARLSQAAYDTAAVYKSKNIISALVAELKKI